jgi:hypothetical protein
MGKISFHAVGTKDDPILLNFLPPQTSNFLPTTPGEKAQANDAGIILTIVGGMPDRLQFSSVERPMARVFRLTNRECHGIDVAVDEPCSQSPRPHCAKRRDRRSCGRYEGSLTDVRLSDGGDPLDNYDFTTSWALQAFDFRKPVCFRKSSVQPEAGVLTLGTGEILACDSFHFDQHRHLCFNSLPTNPVRLIHLRGLELDQCREMSRSVVGDDRATNTGAGSKTGRSRHRTIRTDPAAGEQLLRRRAVDPHLRGIENNAGES